MSATRRTFSAASSQTARGSRASSCTVRASTISHRGTPMPPVVFSEDDDMMEIDPPTSTTSPSTHKKFYIAVDYGTTYSAVSFVALDPDEDPEEVEPHRIRNITNYPDDPRPFGQVAREVPTEICYLNPPKRQNGNGRHRTQAPTGNMASFQNVRVGYDEDSDDAPPYQYDNVQDLTVAANRNWGYMVQAGLGRSNENMSHEDMQKATLRRAKLLLDQSKHTEQDRVGLMKKIDKLKDDNRLKKPEQAIEHFLTDLYRHVRGELERSHGYTDECEVEFILCIPPIWDNRAKRIMHNAMASALRKSGFGKGRKFVKDLFIVSEPEAAACFILTTSGVNHQIRKNETFVLLDAGGGTVDAITYSVESRAQNIRLRKEEVMADGRLCGSSFINERFRELVHEKLENETYLESQGQTINHIIDSQFIMGRFEHQIKRNINFQNPALTAQDFDISNLRANQAKGFRDHAMQINFDEFWGMFRPSFLEVAALMRSQLIQALRANGGKLNLRKVILIGGFAQSQVLQDYLVKQLRKFNTLHNTSIDLVVPEVPGGPGIAVASGGVLRALNKRNGPERIARSSYGILCREVFDDAFPGHLAAEEKADWDIDGNAYVNDTLVWLIKKGDSIPVGQKFRIPMVKIISLKVGESFVCSQSMFVSDTCRTDHYQKNHPVNKGKHERVALIKADMSFLKKNKLIKPTRPESAKAAPHYRVEFEIVLEAIDRNLYYKAVWPAGNDDGVLEGSDGWTSLAPALALGTQ